MTIDNEVKQVFYNGNPVKVDGDLSNWAVLKRFSYNKTAGGELKITGIDHNTEQLGCLSGGLLLACDDGLISDADHWKAFGSTGEEPLSQSDYSRPCLSTSGFGHQDFTSSSAQKIWPSNGKNFAWFSFIPALSGKYLRFLQGI